MDVYLGTKVFENGRRNASEIAHLVECSRRGEISKEEAKRRITSILTDDARKASMEELERLESLVKV